VVYDIVVSLRFVVPNAEDDGTEVVNVFARFLPPGESSTRARAPEGAKDAADNATISFTDSHGTHWRRTARGELVELAQSALVEHGGRGAVEFNWLGGPVRDLPAAGS
jgi:hypothetical protein